MKKSRIKRKLTVTEPAANDFTSYKLKLINLYPELTSFLEEMEVQLNSGCKSCAKKRWYNRLKTEIRNRPVPPEAALLPLEPVLGASFIHSLYSLSPKEHVIDTLRAACPDCCRKHIAQASILVNESLMGYPEHADMALAHLREAAEEIIAQDEQLADSIMQEHNKFDADRNYYPDLMPLLKQAIALLSVDD